MSGSFYRRSLKFKIHNSVKYRLNCVHDKIPSCAYIKINKVGIVKLQLLTEIKCKRALSTMPKKSTTKPNGFFAFATEYKNKNSNNGKAMSMAEATEAAGKIWTVSCFSIIYLCVK